MFLHFDEMNFDNAFPSFIGLLWRQDSILHGKNPLSHWPAPKCMTNPSHCSVAKMNILTRQRVVCILIPSMVCIKLDTHTCFSWFHPWRLLPWGHIAGLEPPAWPQGVCATAIDQRCVGICRLKTSLQWCNYLTVKRTFFLWKKCKRDANVKKNILKIIEGKFINAWVLNPQTSLDHGFHDLTYKITKPLKNTKVSIATNQGLLIYHTRLCILTVKGMLIL